MMASRVLSLLALALALPCAATAQPMSPQPPPAPAIDTPPPAADVAPAPASEPPAAQPVAPTVVVVAPPSMVMPCLRCDQVQLHTAPVLTEPDRALLARGEISVARHVVGAILSHHLSFGIGHMVQGRWRDTGWFFTLGDTASVGLIIAGLSRSFDSCSPAELERGPGCEHRRDNGRWLALGGLTALVALHVAEVYDAISGPTRHNRRVRALRQRVGMSPMARLSPFVVPSEQGAGAMAGLSASF